MWILELLQWCYTRSCLGEKTSEKGKRHRNWWFRNPQTTTWNVWNPVNNGKFTGICSINSRTWCCWCSVGGNPAVANGIPSKTVKCRALSFNHLKSWRIELLSTRCLTVSAWWLSMQVDVVDVMFKATQLCKLCVDLVNRCLFITAIYFAFVDFVVCSGCRLLKNIMNPNAMTINILVHCLFLVILNI